MSIFFICPTNIRFMPYLSYYDNNITENTKKNYIIWDRFSDEAKKTNKLLYQDGLIGHRRGMLSYLKYISFLYKKLSRFESHEDKIVVFGFQTTFFLAPYLFFSKNKYIIDIRDYHYLFRFIPQSIFKKAEFVAVSSPGYRELFMESVNCVVCHNLYDYGVDLEVYSKSYTKPIHVSYMGAIRDLDSQKILIDELANNNKFLINFHGIGDIVPELKDYVVKKSVTNVEFTGRYDKNEEFKFYESASIINMLRDDKSYNDRVALPNRLYSAALFKRPCLCYEGTALAEIVKKYSLGLCLSRKNSIQDSLLNYFDNLSFNCFKRNCNNFLKNVRKEQNIFQIQLQEFIDK